MRSSNHHHLHYQEVLILRHTEYLEYLENSTAVLHAFIQADLLMSTFKQILIKLLNILFHEKQSQNYCKIQVGSGYIVNSAAGSRWSLGGASGNKAPESLAFLNLDGK